jgi:hypothetical protein
MSDLEMDPAKFPAPVKALYERIATRGTSRRRMGQGRPGRDRGGFRRAKGEGFGGPYLALLNHPAAGRARNTEHDELIVDPWQHAFEFQIEAERLDPFGQRAVQPRT